MRVVVAENIVDHIFFLDVIGPHNDEVLNVIAAQQNSCEIATRAYAIISTYLRTLYGVRFCVCG